MPNLGHTLTKDGLDKGTSFAVRIAESNEFVFSVECELQDGDVEQFVIARYLFLPTFVINAEAFFTIEINRNSDRSWRKRFSASNSNQSHP